MQNQDGQVAEPETETTILPTSKLDDWLQFRGPKVVAPKTDPTILPNSKLDDWLHFRDKKVVESKTETTILPTSEFNDWLKCRDARVVEPKTDPTILPDSELNDWLNFQDRKVMEPKTETTILPTSELKDWLKCRDARAVEPKTDPIILPNSELDDWLKCRDPIVLEPETETTILPTSELNDWLNFRDREVVEPETETTTLPPPETNDWLNYRDDEVMQQHSAIQAEEAGKITFVGDKEPLSSLADEYKSGNPILLEKIKVLTEQYAAIRRARGDGNCFFRSFMFAYLEHILESQDRAEVDRITVNVEQCRKTLLSLGYAEFTFEDFFALFLEQLESVLSGKEDSISHEELLQRCRDQSVSDYVVMFFRFITSGEIRKRSEFYEPFIQGLTNTSVEQFCKSSVEPMGEESDHVHITALSDALGVAIRIVYLDRSHDDKGSVSVNHHDFTPEANSSGGVAIKPFITLLYRPGHYDILYPK